MPDAPLDHVVVRLPDWLSGGNPAQFGTDARWSMEPVEGNPGAWRVHLPERVTGGPAQLVEFHRLADATNATTLGQNPHLLALSAQSAHTSGATSPHIQAEVTRILTERPNDLTAVVYCLGLGITTATGQELVPVIEEALSVHLLPVFPDAAVYQITVDRALSYRMAAVRLLLQTDSDPGLLTRRPLSGPDGLVFNSGRSLFSDTAMGLGAYLAPLFLSLAPWVWADPSPRPGGVIALAFGQPVVGRRGEAAELLQLFAPLGRIGGQAGPPVAPASFDAACEWWVSHLDAVFTEIADPCRHKADDGSYDVLAHFESLLSLEQAFRNVQSLSIHDRDVHAQKALLFDSLDTISGVRPPSFDDMCKLTQARRALAQVEATMSADVAEVLLPRARAAVDALEEFQKGFFLHSRVTSAGVRVPDGQGDRVLPMEAAAAQYLRVLRNAVHGFGGRKLSRDRALLVSHTGQIPMALPDLAYLYLLRLLARPEDLRRRR